MNNTPIQTAQAFQATISSLDFTQCSSLALSEIISLLKNVQTEYISDQLTNASPETVATIVSTFTSANQARLSTIQTAQITP